MVNCLFVMSIREKKTNVEAMCSTHCFITFGWTTIIALTFLVLQCHDNYSKVSRGTRRGMGAEKLYFSITLFMDSARPID